MAFGSMFDKAKEKAATLALNTVGRSIVNTNLSGIVEFREIRVEDGRPVLHFTLEGLPDREIKAVVHSITIAEDGTSVTLANYESDMPFVQNALNRFASLTVPVKDASVARALSMARFLFVSVQ